MENQLFTSSLIPSSLHVEPLLQFPDWQTFEMQMNGSSDQSLSGFYNSSNWESLNDREMKFNSLSSSLMMSSNVVTSHPRVSTETSVIRELIGKLGSTGNSSRFSASPPSHAMFGQSSRNNSQSNSSYNTPLNSPPKLNSFPLNSSVAEFSADPGFAERAAKFSCLGSNSFNGRTSQFGLNNVELPHNPSLPMVKEKLPRVSSSPLFNFPQSQMNVLQNKRSTLHDRTELSNSQDESSVSQLVSSGEIRQGATNDSNSRKRKAVPRGKAKESAPLPSSGASMADEDNEKSEMKRRKQNERNGKESDCAEAEAQDGARRSPSTAGDEKQNWSDSKLPEPPKDYIHVRARRGQATDSHSLAERVRREKISERMKILQDLVPGCNKVIGKALMLDEIINYVQSLQRQVEFLSMKLATVNTSMDFNNDPLLSKDTFQSNKGFQHSAFPVDSSSATFLGLQSRKIPALSSNILNGAVAQSSVDPLNGTKMLSMDELKNNNGHAIPYQAFCGDDLQTIIEMGFGQSTQTESAFNPRGFLGSGQVSEMKFEL